MSKTINTTVSIKSTTKKGLNDNFSFAAFLKAAVTDQARKENLLNALHAVGTLQTLEDGKSRKYVTDVLALITATDESKVGTCAKALCTLTENPLTDVTGSNAYAKLKALCRK